MVEGDFVITGLEAFFDRLPRSFMIFVWSAGVFGWG